MSRLGCPERCLSWRRYSLLNPGDTVFVISLKRTTMSSSRARLDAEKDGVKLPM